MSDFTIQIAPNVHSNFNFDKFKVEKIVDGNKVTKIWHQMPDRCDLASYRLSNDYSDIRFDFTQKNGYKGKTWLPLQAESGRIRRGVNVFQSISSNIPEEQVDDLLKLPVKQQERAVFSGKFPRVIKLAKDNGARAIWESLGSRDVIVNDKEYFHVRNFAKGRKVIDKAKFSGFEFSFGQLNINNSFDFSKLSKKSQAAVKSILKEALKTVK